MCRCGLTGTDKAPGPMQAPCAPVVHPRRGKDMRSPSPLSPVHCSRSSSGHSPSSLAKAALAGGRGRNRRGDYRKRCHAPPPLLRFLPLCVLCRTSRSVDCVSFSPAARLENGDGTGDGDDGSQPVLAFCSLLQWRHGSHADGPRRGRGAETSLVGLARADALG
jgi:hypothetical protein